MFVPQRESPVEVKPRKPAGAVSMFGGMDPTALMKKKPSPTLDMNNKVQHRGNQGVSTVSNPGPEVINLHSCSAQLSTIVIQLISTEINNLVEISDRNLVCQQMLAI